MLADVIVARLDALDLSERAACIAAKVDLSAIRRIRAGMQPKPATLNALSPVLGIPVADLMAALENQDAPAGAAALPSDSSMPSVAPPPEDKAAATRLALSAAERGDAALGKKITSLFDLGESVKDLVVSLAEKARQPK